MTASLSGHDAARGRLAPRLLPDCCALDMVLGIVVYAELLAIVLTLAAPAALSSFWVRLGPLSLLIQLIALTSATLLCALSRWPGRPLSGPFGALLAWGAIMAAAAMIALAAGHLLSPPLAQFLLPADGAAGLRARTLTIAAIVGALWLRYLYLHQQWRSHIEAIAEARVQTLQARIRPHFLFNSMNTIASLARSDPVLAEEIVLDLADLFRAALANDGTTSTLAAELELARRYLNIERQRLGARLRVEWDLDELPQTVPVPPLLLQPLVENAVYHGIQPAAAPGCIRIGGRRRGAWIELEIRNRLPTAAERRVARPPGQGMALANIRQRLAALYPDQAWISCTQDENEYVVRVRFPIIQTGTPPHPGAAHEHPVGR